MAQMLENEPLKDVGNKISIIKNKLLILKSEKDVTENDIENLQNEKISIRKTIPKLLHVLIQHRDNINAQQAEINILGMILFLYVSHFVYCIALYCFTYYLYILFCYFVILLFLLNLDKAITDIEETYGHILYSPDFYDDPENNEKYRHHRGRRNRRRGDDDEDEEEEEDRERRADV